MDSPYNVFTGIDDYAYKIIVHLMQDPKAENLWKMLYYDVPDALQKPNLTMSQKASIIWNNQSADSSSYRVFMTPMLDDLQDQQVSMLRIYVGEIHPDDRTRGTVDIHFQIFSHNKLDQLNVYKMRQTAMLRVLLESLNGIEVNSLGKLFFNRQASSRDRSSFSIDNSRNFHGYFLCMSTKVGGSSNE